jgi:hypothetical protein
MKLYQRILICGAARQGNTLLMHLLGTGFRGVRICHGERVPNGEAMRPGQIAVGKRPGAIMGIGRLLDQWDLGIIFTMRDPRDVVTSKHMDGLYWRRAEQWVKRAALVHGHQEHPRAMVVRYERLIRDPDTVQAEIGAKFGLTICRPFASCHKHFDRDDVVGILAMHGPRPLDRSRIGHWKESEEKRQIVAEALETTPEMSHWMKVWGYDPPR